MLYIGHFSFDEIDVDGSQGHGYLSSIVTAKNPDEVIDKFEHHLRELKRRLPAMAGVVSVYIEEILQFSQVPETPVATRLQFSEGAFPVSVSYSLPDMVDERVSVFGYSPDVENQEALKEEKCLESEPFITFDS
jgi:hypothetical protein